ncbi:MAG: Abi family protein [Spirochaetaceae bacterium]|jgi:abortive infection bacteriophage resistance protein|nr:Abi family protein [Spirochaetaceae bacterium]
MNNVKPFLTYEAQVEKICSNGCEIEDKPFAVYVLSRLNYYRFSAYFLPFKQSDGFYRKGTTFKKIFRIYEFDRKLRNIIFAAIARTEIYLRTKIAYYHAKNYGALGYMDSNNFKAHKNYNNLLELIESEKQKNSRILFVRHHVEKYDGNFPIWVIIELFTFGMLSRFYSVLPTYAQKMLAKELSVATPKILMSWFRCCTDLRNICAHHGRLYYRIFSAIPAGLQDLKKTDKQRVFGMLLVLKTLYADKTEWNKEVYSAICALVDEYNNDIDFKHIGFTGNWRKLLVFSMSEN